jgi:hypothetical protein
MDQWKKQPVAFLAALWIRQMVSSEDGWKGIPSIIDTAELICGVNSKKDRNEFRSLLSLYLNR